MATYELSATPEHDALLNVMFAPLDLDPLITKDELEIKARELDHHLIEGDTMKEAHTQIQVPTHPIPSMQAAFAESMREAAEGTTSSIPKNALGSASARRKVLLDQDINDPTHAARWQSRPGMRYHELWKLMAQISFGIYLLLNGIAKDDEQVMNILQGHVDEVDEFLETTLEDFDLAQQDVDERLKFLKLPLENIAIFDAMLEDRTFRLQIVNGNERIEHAITRTATAMNDALKDVKQGLNACKEFTIYLAEEQDDPTWKMERPDMQKVFDAMKGNVEGWHQAYVSLQTKGNHLGVGLVQLGSIVAEMDRRAGDVSRKKRFSVPQSTAPQPSPPTSPVRHSRQMRQSMLKTLPEDPSQITPAIRATLPAFQLVGDRDKTQEPEVESESEPYIPDDESLAELEAPPEDLFILKPHTYTPQASPREPPKPRIATPPPEPQQIEITKKPSLRQRFSLKRKDSPSQTSSTRGTDETTRAPPRPKPSYTIPRPDERIVKTPPSRDLDSAYCSDFEKTSPPPLQRPVLHQKHSFQSTQSARTQPLPQRIFTEVVPSPRSEQQQFFRPVNASPHSPLQRPWTAAPPQHGISHIHNNSSTSNLSTMRGQPTPSLLGNRRGAPSTMGMSMRSEMTTVTDVNGQKIKKKRSAFGWLKKAFSLSEEEKAAFEEKRRKNDHTSDAYRRDYYQKPAPRWVDGKKVRSSASQRNLAV